MPKGRAYQNAYYYYAGSCSSSSSSPGSHMNTLLLSRLASRWPAARTCCHQERRVSVYISAVARSNRMLLQHLQEVTAGQQDYQSATGKGRATSRTPGCVSNYLLGSRSLATLHESQELGA
jgi:hypothetical protein